MSYNIEQANSGFLSLTAAGLAEGTNSATFKTTNTLTFTNNGVFKSKAATDNLTFSTGTALAASHKVLSWPQTILAPYPPRLPPTSRWSA